MAKDGWTMQVARTTGNTLLRDWQATTGWFQESNNKRQLCHPLSAQINTLVTTSIPDEQLSVLYNLLYNAYSNKCNSHNVDKWTKMIKKYWRLS